MVDMLLGGMKWVSAVEYVNDIIAYSNTWEKHLAHVRQLLEALRRANLQLHPGKCQYGTRKVKYVEHLVSRDGIKACPFKVQAIAEMLPPKNVKDIFSSTSAQIMQRSTGTTTARRPGTHSGPH